MEVPCDMVGTTERWSLKFTISAYMCTKNAHNLQNQEIMKREQIIHALYTQKVIGNIDLMELLEKAGYKDYSISAIIDRITDAILALPLDVPSDGEIEKTAMDYAPVYYLGETNCDVNAQIREEVEDLLKDMRDEIIKRNRVINRDDKNER